MASTNNSNQQFTTLLIAGLACLIVSFTMNGFAKGLFIGISIVLMIMAVLKRRRDDAERS